MMRASVLILATAVATAACRDNPGFMLSGGRDGGGETGASSEAGEASSGSTGDAVCAPVPDHTVADACQEQAQPATPPNLATSGLFAMESCGAATEILVKRTANVLHACKGGCGDCPMDQAVGIGAASAYSKYDALLPPDGKCARLWHISDNVVGTGEMCNSVAYAVFDEDGPLRFAVSYGEVNPFEGVAGFDFSAGVAATEPCASASFEGECDMGNVPATLTLSFHFGTCELPAAQQETAWTDIVVDDYRYVLELLASYVCVNQDPVITWFLHRE